MKNLYLEKSLGIDIREDSVCLTLLGKNIFRVDVLAAKYITVQSLNKENEKAESHFLEQVNRFMIEHDAWTENVVISIPRSKLTLQSFELPSPDRKSVDSMMEFELERHFSSSIENFYYSNHITVKEGNQYHIVCAAINKEVAKYYLDLLGKLNLKPTVLDVSTFANLNLLWPNGENQETLSVLADLSLNSIDISILNNRTLEFSRSIPVNDPEYRKAFLSPETQEKTLESVSDRIARVVVEEIENALASCRNIDDSISVEAIHISGGGPFAPYLASRLEAATGVQVFRLQPPRLINPSVPKNFSMAFMATSLGLAFRELKQNLVEANLLPESLTTTYKKKISIKKTAALALATLLFVIGFMANQNIHNNKILASLDKQLDEIKAQMGPLEKVDLEYETLQKYISTLNRIDEINPIKLPLLTELSRIIPKDTWVKKIQFKKGKMELKGISKSASQLVPIVESSSHFRDTRFMGTIITEPIGEKFTIITAVGAKE